MYLMSSPERPTAVTLTGASTTTNIYDLDLSTSVETPSLTPILVFDLGSAKRVDSLFLKGANLKNVPIEGSTDNTNWTALGTAQILAGGNYSFFNFTNATSYRYYRLRFPIRGSTEGNYRIDEVFLCRMVLNLNALENRPQSLTIVTPRGPIIQRDIVQRFGLDKRQFSMQFENLDESVARQIIDWWHDTDSDTAFTLYPRPDARPGQIYQVNRSDDTIFFMNMGISAAAGNAKLLKSGSLLFQER